MSDAPTISVEDETPDNTPVDEHPKKERSGWIAWLWTLVIAIALAWGIQAFIVKPFRIPSESMVPTLQIGDRILVDRVTPRVSDYKPGQIVVFHPSIGAETASCGIAHPRNQACPQSIPQLASTYYVKRIVGVGGDTIRVVGGQVFRNGKLFKVPGARIDAQCDICNLPKSITVPKGQIFLMGDNRGSSLDSRVWGPVPVSAMIGIARAVYWPPQNIDIL